MSGTLIIVGRTDRSLDRDEQTSQRLSASLRHGIEILLTWVDMDALGAWLQRRNSWSPSSDITIYEIFRAHLRMEQKEGRVKFVD